MSRDLDREIAEKVFGQHVETAKRWVIIQNHPHHQEDVLQIVGDLDSLPRYSSNIAEAWRVVDEMRRQDRYNGFCHSVHEEIGFDKYISEDLGWLLFERPAEEVARLICLGALRAIADPSVLDLGGGKVVDQS